MDEDRSYPQATEIEPTESSAGNEFTGRQKFWISFGMGAACCAVLLIICFMVLPRALGLGKFVDSSDLEYYEALEADYGKYYTIMKMIDEDPLAEKTPEMISDDTLKDLVKSTGDPYAEYFTAEEYKQFEKPFRSDYIGIGITVTDTDAGVTVISVMPDQPAEQAGMESGDIITAIDGEKPADTQAAIAVISAEADKELTITVSREGASQDLVIKTARIEIQTVGSSTVEDHPEIGYIRISTFGEDTAKDFKLAVRDLQNEGCEKFIIDLMNNTGGLTDTSVEIADFLLPACKIMTDVTKDGKETVYNSDASSADIECVVLVDENTASASEILTGALQDNKAAVIIGKTTYGKGVTQLSHRFSDGSAVKLTVSEYYRPNGDKVNGSGITPDIEADYESVMDTAIKELEDQ